MATIPLIVALLLATPPVACGPETGSLDALVHDLAGAAATAGVCRIEGALAPSDAFTRETGTKVFKAWVHDQVHNHPLHRATHRDLSARIVATPPATVRELFSAAREIAAGHVAAQPGTPTDPISRDRLVNLAAMVSVGALALEMSPAFPQFIPDGRPGEWGFDKTWHLSAQGMLAYVIAFDRGCSDGRTAAALERTVESVDAPGMSSVVAAAYDAIRGAHGPMLPGTLAGPAYAGVATYFPRPADLSLEEARAYDHAVRVGDAYEHALTDRPYDPAKLGTHPELADPLASVDATFDIASGLGDSSVPRDLTANRVGAWLGVQLFRTPADLPKIPWDEGTSWKGRPYAPGVRGTLADYYADESVLLARLGGLTDGAASLDREAHARWAAAAGPAAASQELLRKVAVQTERLAADRETLGRLYANHAIRHLRMGVDFGPLARHIPQFEPHRLWAMSAPAEVVKSEMLFRADAVLRAYSP